MDPPATRASDHGWLTQLSCLGMRYSLQTREIIADSIESVTCAQRHDANISIPGCDKNMPGVVIAAARHNRPFLMIYGGTIMKGRSALLDQDINISTCYEAQGAFVYGKLHAKCKDPTVNGKPATPSDVMDDIEQHACPGAGACGGSKRLLEFMFPYSYHDFGL